MLKHSRDFNLTRECVLGSRLDARTPAYDVQQACGTGLEAAILVANKIALGQIDAGIAGGVDTTSRRAARRQRGACAGRCWRSTGPGRLGARLQGASPAAAGGGVPRRTCRATPSRAPGCPWASTPRSPPREWRHRPAEPRTSWRSPRTSNLAAAYDRGFFDDLITPYLGLTRDENLRPDTTLEKLAALRPVFGTAAPDATMTAGNSSALSDGAVDGAARAPTSGPPRAGCRCWRTSTFSQTAAVDFVHGGEGLLMAPVYAVPRMLDRAGLGLADFDFYEIHEAFASQVLATLAAWEDPAFAKERLGRDAPLGGDRPGEAQRRRVVARRRPPVRGDRRPDRGDAGEAAGREGIRPRPDLDLRRRRPGRDGDPRTLTAGRPRPDRPAPGRRAARPGGPGVRPLSAATARR